jgi:hypothetical protein
MDDTQFDQFLRNNKASAPISVPASFQREVWQRIEAADESAILTPWQWLNQVIAVMTRSLGSAACVAVMIVAGIWLGSLGVNPAEAAKAAYIDSINPLSQSH